MKNTMHEMSDMPKMKENSRQEITKETKEAYDRWMMDDQLPDNPSYYDNRESRGTDDNPEINKIEEASEGLKNEEKQMIKNETGWSDENIDYIQSVDEYEIYKRAGLHEAEIGGKKALIRDDIEWGQKDEKGRTNEERIMRGLAPLDKSGNSIELHHIGQHADSPLAELSFKEHRCNGNDTVLHDKKKPSETHGEGNTWDNERQEYWKSRDEYNKSQNWEEGDN